jgi:hypothetical protein
MLGACGIKQDPRCFNRVARNTDDPISLPMVIALLVSIDYPDDLSGFIMLNLKT